MIKQIVFPIMLLLAASLMSSFSAKKSANDNRSKLNFERFTTGGPDTFGYTYIDSDEVGGSVAFEDISVSGTATGLSDDGETNVRMPFEFDLYGTVSSDVRIGGNGAIRFGQTTGNINATNGNFPNNGTPNLIAPWWDDLYADDTGAEVYYETKGTAPNRRFIVQWHDIGHYNLSNGPSITFQVVLYEGTNNIDFVYNDTDFGSASYTMMGPAQLLGLTWIILMPCCTLVILQALVGLHPFGLRILTMQLACPLLLPLLPSLTPRKFFLGTIPKKS